jgi:hypothetical protein
MGAVRARRGPGAARLSALILGAGDAHERFRYHAKPLDGNLFSAADTAAVVIGTYTLQGVGEALELAAILFEHVLVHTFVVERLHPGKPTKADTWRDGLRLLFEIGHGSDDLLHLLPDELFELSALFFGHWGLLMGRSRTYTA